MKEIFWFLFIICVVLGFLFWAPVMFLAFVGNNCY